MSAQPAGARFVGQSVHRVEDDRILTGGGRYADDIKLPRMVHAVFVRSMLPHARVLSVDADEARALPGVLAVITGDELAAASQPVPPLIPNLQEPYPVFHGLATDKVRYVGDPVAIVVAESRYLAEDARDAIQVEYDPLDPVATADQALSNDAPLVFEDVPGNLFAGDTMSFGDLDAAFAEADVVVRETLRCARVTQVPMETRGGVADFNPATRELVYYAASQSPQAVRLGLSQTLELSAERVRVVSPDIGGSFGQKAFMTREDLTLCFAARRLGRPVKWIEDRVENLSSASSAREETFEVAVAAKRDGTILGFDVKLTLDQGAYPFAFPNSFIGGMMRTMLPGAYRIESLRWEQAIVATNKVTAGAYRGPWAAESLIRETMINRVAAELELDPVEVRRLNLVPLEEQPRKMATGPTLEGATSAQSLEHAVARVDYEGFRAEQERARAEGRLLGIGFATYIEPAPGPPDMSSVPGTERAIARLEPDGHLTVITGQTPHGQGHETTLAQISAEEFGLPLDHVRIVHGDTAVQPFNLFGTGGSQAATMATGAALHATRAVKQKTLRIASDVLEIAADDLEIVDAVIRPRGVPAVNIAVAQVAAGTYFGEAPPGEEPGLRSEAMFTQPRGGWSGGTHVCFVEIDRETGIVSVPRYVVVEDCGRLINPAIVDGQIRGGVAQGIGLALLEHAIYDEDGNFLTGTFMDYLVPTAMEIPSIEIEHLESVPLHEVDFRGVGEGGTIAAPPAVVNAVSDALGGLAITELPLTPDRVLSLIDTMDA
jgi:aerobic carbon-monoxide dehydrogenase large subunit